MRGEYVMPSMGRITVGELVGDWLCPQEAGDNTSYYRTLESAACACRAKMGGS